MPKFSGSNFKPLRHRPQKETLNNMVSTTLLLFFALASATPIKRATKTNILVTNDDGWAVAQIRSEFDALDATGLFNVSRIFVFYWTPSSCTGGSSFSPARLSINLEQVTQRLCQLCLLHPANSIPALPVHPLSDSTPPTVSIKGIVRYTNLTEKLTARLNYVNAFPYVFLLRSNGTVLMGPVSISVDAARFGIETLAPKFFNGQKPDFVVSGSNVGSE